MVVCPHRLASAAGADILRAGGNAIDAAIATQAALGVVYPHMTGLGGDAFWLIYDAAHQGLLGLNGSGRAAQSATVEFYRDQKLTQIPHRGPLSAITVPGAVDSWGVAHERLGHLPWADLLQPAIALATHGYPATGSQAYWTRQDQADLKAHAADSPFLPKGNLPQPEQRLTNPDLAATLETLAQAGSRSLYQGELAERIDAHLKTVGGLLTAQDLASHRSDWVIPISTTYRGHRVCQLPPNSQGLSVLQALNLIEAYDLQAIGHGTADYYHLLVEALKLAFADRDRWLTDPDFAQIPTEHLISKTYGNGLRSRIDMGQAQAVSATAIGGDTVYTAIVDGTGNAVSVIQSLYFDFGSTVMVPGTGFVLQNRGSFFSLNAEQSNCLAPHKRSFHTLMPGMVLTNNRPEWVLGTMGGEGQPQTQLALLTRTLDYGFAPQPAIDLPRWLWGRTWGESNSGLTVEGRIPATVRAELQRRGHPVKAAPDWTEKMGHAHMIHIDPVTGALQGGCDRRSDGAIACGPWGPSREGTRP
jgi:gamma-glutamyltranspeptidase